MLSPVFLWEWVRRSRRPSQWWIRAGYVSLLLLFLFGAYQSATQWLPSIGIARIHSRIGYSFYQSFTICQLLAVLLLGPLHAAGTIVEERIHGTLPLLLLSRLGEGDIILSKLCHSLLRVWEALLSALPLLSLCLILGGVSPFGIVCDFLLAMATAMLVCSVGIVASLYSRTFAGAIVFTYVLLGAWFALPLALEEIDGGRGVIAAIPEEFQWINATALVGRRFGQNSTEVVAYATSILFQTMFSTVLIVFACRRVRSRGSLPITSEHSSRISTARLAGNTSRARELPVDDARPLRWRELRQRSDPLPDQICRLFYLGGTPVLFFLAGWQLWRAGPVPAGYPMPLLVIVPGVLAASLLGIFVYPYLTALAASAFAEEKERGILDQLRLANLSQRQIVAAKHAGLLRRALRALAFPMVLLTVPCLVGWTSPWALLLAVAISFAAAAMVIAIGLLVGLRVKNSSRAVVVAVAFVLVVTLIVPMARYVSVGSRSKTNLYLFMPLCPSFQATVLVTRDCTREYQPLVYGSSRMEQRTIAIVTILVYLQLALILYRRCLAPLGPWREEGRRGSPRTAQENDIQGTALEGTKGSRERFA